MTKQPTKCAHDRTLIVIVPKKLWLSECCSYGPATIGKGAVEDARRVVEHAGGFQALRLRLAKEQQDRKDKAAEEARNRPKPVGPKQG